MIKLLGRVACGFLFVSLVAFAWLKFGAANSQLTVTINGQQVEGTQKLLMGSAGLLVAGGVTLAALSIAALTMAGSGFLVFAALALTALSLIVIAVPFLLPLAIPIIIFAFILALYRRSPRPNGV